jgi:hypothetical protein
MSAMRAGQIPGGNGSFVRYLDFLPPSFEATRAFELFRDDPVSHAGSLRRERNGPRTSESERQAGEHHEVGMKADALQATSAKRGESVVVLQAPELALDRDSALVETQAMSSQSGDRPGNVATL